MSDVPKMEFDVSGQNGQPIPGYAAQIQAQIDKQNAGRIEMRMDKDMILKLCDSAAVNGRLYVLGLAVLCYVLAHDQPAYAVMWHSLILWAILIVASGYVADVAQLTQKRFMHMTASYFAMASGIALPIAILYGLWS